MRLCRFHNSTRAEALGLFVPANVVTYGPATFRWTRDNPATFNDTAPKWLSEAVANTHHFHCPVHSPRDYNPGVHPSLTLTSMVTPGFIFFVQED
jgi:hypothetical protein